MTLCATASPKTSPKTIPLSWSLVVLGRPGVEGVVAVLVKLSFCDQSAPTVLSLDGFDSVVPDPVPYVLERENPARHHAGGPGYVGQQVDTLEGRFCGDEIRRRLRHGISVGGSGEVHPAEDRVGDRK